MGGNNVLLHTACQPADAAFFRAFRHGADSVEVAVRDDGEARLNYVHSQSFQLHGNLYFLLHGHRRAGALFSVSQRRIKNMYVFFHYSKNVKGSFLRKLRTENVPVMESFLWRKSRPAVYFLRAGTAHRRISRYLHGLPSEKQQ